MIENIDWQITSKCNRKCSYCFGPTEEFALTKENAKKCIDIFHSIGAKQIGLSGGEPLLYPYFEEVVKYIKNKSINLYLSTNCDLYHKYSSTIKKNVSIIGISIDGSNPSIHDNLRGEGNFDACINTLEDIMNSNAPIRMKIGTVVTNKNIADIEQIAELLARYEEKIIFWKLYELISYEKNYEDVCGLKPKTEIDLNKLVKYFNTKKIINDNIKKRTRSYFFVKPNGDVFTPILDIGISKELIIGNLFQNEIHEIVSAFEKEVVWEGYNKNYRYMKGL